MHERRKPTPVEVEAARGKRVPDVVRRDLNVIFCGINPGLYSAAVGLHFARPGNRFWRALHESGFTPELLSPYEQERLLDYGCGVTNLVGRATAVAAELSGEELRRGRVNLARRMKRWRPACVAVLGIGAYRTAFRRPRAALGPQEDLLSGTRLWVVPNPSGLNANYQLPELTALFRELRSATAGWK